MPKSIAPRVTLDPRSRRLTARLVKSGRYASAEDVARAAFRLLEEEERDSAECVEGIRRGLADAGAGREEPWETFRRDFEQRHGLRRNRLRRAK
jgi:antitoxin ParD1/3/4